MFTAKNIYPRRHFCHNTRKNPAGKQLKIVYAAQLTTVIFTPPSASDLTYGETLNQASLTDGEAGVNGNFFHNKAIVPGDWVFANPTFVPSVGKEYYSVIFTPTDQTYESVISDTTNLAESGVAVTVSAAQVTIVSNPNASDLTYGQALKQSTLVGGVANVKGAFVWTNPADVPVVDSLSHSVDFVPADKNNYAGLTLQVNVTVKPATPPALRWPTASSIIYGQNLSKSVLTGGTAGVEGTFVWTNMNDVPVAGSIACGVDFLPTDAENYVEDHAQVNVTVIPATPTVMQWPTASSITYGQNLSSSVLTGGSTSVPGTFNFMPSNKPMVRERLYAVVFQPDDAQNYSTVIQSITVVIAQATPSISALPTASKIRLGQKVNTASLTGGSVNVPGTFSWADNTSVLQGDGRFPIVFTPTDKENYKTLTANPQTYDSIAPRVATGSGSTYWKIDQANSTTPVVISLKPDDGNNAGNSAGDKYTIKGTQFGGVDGLDDIAITITHAVYGRWSGVVDNYTIDTNPLPTPFTVLVQVF